MHGQNHIKFLTVFSMQTNAIPVLLSELS